jgi:predicted Zn-dependent protease
MVDGRLPGAFVWSRRSKRHRVSKDSEEQTFDVENFESVVFGGDGHTFATHNSSYRDLLVAAERFVADLPAIAQRKAGASESFLLPKPTAFQTTLGIDPAKQGHDAFLEPVVKSYAQAQEQGSSRIIYRNSYLLSDDVESRFLSREHNQRVREVRFRSGVVFAAWTGDEVVTSVAERAALGGLELTGPSVKELREGAQRALAHVHARSAPSGIKEVILSSECAGLVAMEAIAKPGFVHGPRPTPRGPLRVSNDPTRKRGYGSYLRDARGATPNILSFFGDMPVTRMHEGNMRRDDALTLRPMPSNVVVDAGTATELELIADVKEGVLLEAPLHCSVDPAGTSLALLCGRGREIRNGHFTGRVFSRLVATAACDAFFDDTRALGKRRRSHAFQTGSIAMSARSPSWLSRAQVEAG